MTGVLCGTQPENRGQAARATSRRQRAMSPLFGDWTAAARVGLGGAPPAPNPRASKNTNHPGDWCTATSHPSRRLARRSRRGPRWTGLLARNRTFRALISFGTETAGRGTTTGATPFGTSHLDERRDSLRAAEADQRAREADVQRLTPELEAAQALDARRADAQEHRERSAEGLAALVDVERTLAAATGGAERAVADGAGGAR